MSDREAFLRTIRANPDDDTVRLVFADWLHERGEEERAEFVRVQIELEPVRFQIDNPRAVELHQREDELLARHRDEWVGEVPHFTNPSDFGPVFRRGFPDHACLSLDTFLSHGEVLFAACPTLREVALYGLANRCSELTLSPLLAKLDTLEIADWLTEDDAISLSVSPHLDRISRFKLWAGAEPYFLRELAKQAGATWPREIELVQVWGGVGCSHHTRTPSARAADADQAAREANEQLGREAVRVTRPFQRRLPLDGRVGRHLYAGHLPDGRPALAAVSVGPWMLVVFDADGRVVEVNRRASAITWENGPDGGWMRQNGSAELVPWNEAEAQVALSGAIEQWVDELKLVLGVIWVREFSEDRLIGVVWLPGWMSNAAEPEQHTIAGEWRDHGEVRGWLKSRDFAVYWPGGSGDADWRGKIYEG